MCYNEFKAPLFVCCYSEDPISQCVQGTQRQTTNESLPLEMYFILQVVSIGVPFPDYVCY